MASAVSRARSSSSRPAIWLRSVSTSSEGGQRRTSSVGSASAPSGTAPRPAETIRVRAESTKSVSRPVTDRRLIQTSHQAAPTFLARKLGIAAWRVRAPGRARARFRQPVPRSPRNWREASPCARSGRRPGPVDPSSGRHARRSRNVPSRRRRSRRRPPWRASRSRPRSPKCRRRGFRRRPGCAGAGPEPGTRAPFRPSRRSGGHPI